MTDGSGSWVGEDQALTQQHLHQPRGCRSSDDRQRSRFSVFWAREPIRLPLPQAALYSVGKHVGEDPVTTRVPTKRIGFIVIEAGKGTIGEQRIPGRRGW